MSLVMTAASATAAVEQTHAVFLGRAGAETHHGQCEFGASDMLSWCAFAAGPAGPPRGEAQSSPAGTPDAARALAWEKLSLLDNNKHTSSVLLLSLSHLSQIDGHDSSVLNMVKDGKNKSRDVRREWLHRFVCTEWTAVGLGSLYFQAWSQSEVEMKSQWVYRFLMKSKTQNTLKEMKSCWAETEPVVSVHMLYEAIVICVLNYSLVVFVGHWVRRNNTKERL